MSRIARLLLSTALVGSLVFAMNTSAGAQALPAPGTSALQPVGPFLLNFDENGNGTIRVGTGPTILLHGILGPDPAVPGGGGAPVLIYVLPEPVITGDVSFTETAGIAGNSDWLRFTDAAGHISGVATGPGPQMIFYSDILEVPLDLADHSFPTNLGSGNFLALVQVGPEGNNGFDYRPGGVPAPLNNEYVGKSDAPVPEPASLVLLGSGLAVMGLILCRRRR